MLICCHIIKYGIFQEWYSNNKTLGFPAYHSINGKELPTEMIHNVKYEMISNQAIWY